MNRGVGDEDMTGFEPEARAFYNLESLWGDAPRVDVPEPVAQAQEQS